MQKLKQTTKGMNFGRFALYIGGKLLVVAIAVILIFFAFNTARNSAEIYMVAKDGFAFRNSIILFPGEEDNENYEKLDGVFTQEYLQRSGLKTDMRNASYTVRAYDEKTSVPIKVIFSWQNKATVRITNVVQDIISEINTAVEYSPVTELIESGTYLVHFIKDSEGNWKIDDIVLEERKEIEPEHQRPLPSPDAKEEDLSPGEETVPEDTPLTQ